MLHPPRCLPPTLLLLAACTTWQPVPLPTPADTAPPPRGIVRVTAIGGATLLGRDPFLRNDFLIVPRGDGGLDSLHRDRVVLIEQSVTDERRSFLIIGAVLGAGILLIVALSHLGPGGGSLGY